MLFLFSDIKSVRNNFVSVGKRDRITRFLCKKSLRNYGNRKALEDLFALSRWHTLSVNSKPTRGEDNVLEDKRGDGAAREAGIARGGHCFKDSP